MVRSPDLGAVGAKPTRPMDGLVGGEVWNQRRLPGFLAWVTEWIVGVATVRVGGGNPGHGGRGVWEASLSLLVLLLTGWRPLPLSSSLGSRFEEKKKKGLYFLRTF